MTINRQQLEALLRDYARRQPEDRQWTDAEREQFQDQLKAELSDVADSRAHPPRIASRRIIAAGGALAAAVVALVLLIPGRKDELHVRAYSTGPTRGDARFEVSVTTAAPAVAYLIVLDENREFSVLAGSDGGGTLIEGRGRLGSYVLTAPASTGRPARRTHAIIVACRDPIGLERLAAVVPDTLASTTSLEDVRAGLARELGCEVAVAEIPPP